MRRSLIGLWLALVLTRCGGGDKTVTSIDPMIALSPSHIAFQATAGGANPAGQSVAVSNGGGGTLEGLSVFISHIPEQPTGWLTASLDRTVAPATLMIQSNVGALSPGSYGASVVVQAAGASNGSVGVEVQFVVAQGPPNAPSQLVATGVSASEIRINWADGSNNEVGFRVERCSGPSCSAFVEVGTVGSNVTSLLDGGLAAATSYSYRVRASNAAGQSGYSNVASAQTSAALVAPSNLTASAVSAGQINLTWSDNSSNETGFEIERCASAGCANFASLGSVTANATGYVSSGLINGTSYSYRVRAINAGGSSNYSNTASATTATLLAPALGVPSVSGSSITLSWTYGWGGIVSSNDGYALEQSTSATSGFVQVFSVVSTTSPYSTTRSSLAPGTYYFRVRASTLQGWTPYSVVRSATIAAPPASLTAYATEDNTLLYSSVTPGLANTVYRLGTVSTGCNWSVIFNPDLGYVREVACGEGLFRFNVQAAIQGRSIRHAELRLWVDALGADIGTTFRVAAVARTWSTTTVTLNNFHNGAEVYNAGQSQQGAPITRAVPYVFDVTYIVQQWANQSFLNNGLFIWDSGLDLPTLSLLRAVDFESADAYSDPAKRPQLIIDFN